jgi:3-phosphoshikimate 1-carboxyvinyltransferase
MWARIVPGSGIAGEARVPGDKSIAHRWLILAATGRGRSELREVPLSLDVRSTAACLSAVTNKARPSLDRWARNGSSMVEGGGSTWNEEAPAAAAPRLEVEGEGRSALVLPDHDLDCGNSGTTMRLLSGVVAASPLRVVLQGDESLRTRPMERVAEPLRAMGAAVRTTDGHAPLEIEGTALRGIRYRLPVPSAQVKSAVLLAAVAADGETVVEEPAPTRDHTERALEALGAPVRRGDGRVIASRYQHDGFSARVPGDPSSAAFLVVAAVLGGSSLTIRDVGLNPTRLHYLAVLGRMGVTVEAQIESEELGEPLGSLHVYTTSGIRPTRVGSAEIPLVIDEVPILAALAAHADGVTTFSGVGELRVKESDRLAAIAAGLRALGGDAVVDGDDLVVDGGGLGGGTADAGGDHRMAMSFAVAALAARGTSEIAGMEAADVSFPGFVPLLASLGASIEGSA